MGEESQRHSQFHLFDPMSGLRYPSRAELVVGRTFGQILFPFDQGVSGKHLRVGYDARGVWVEDFGSANGTFVGMARVPKGERIYVALPAVIRFGGRVLRLEPGLAPADAAPLVDVRSLRKEEKPPMIGLAIGLGVLHVLVYAWQCYKSGEYLTMPMSRLWEWGANARFLTVDDGWWRVLIAMFLHPDLLSLCSNLLALALLAPVVLQYAGPVGFVVTYLLSGMGGSVFNMVLSQYWVVNVGATPAVLGLYGAIAGSLLLDRRQDKVFHDKAIGFATVVFLIQIFAVPHAGQPVNALSGGFLIGFMYIFFCGLALHDSVPHALKWLVVFACGFIMAVGTVQTGATRFRGEAAYLAIREANLFDSYTYQNRKHNEDVHRQVELAREAYFVAREIEAEVLALKPLDEEEERIRNNLLSANRFFMASLEKWSEYLRTDKVESLEQAQRAAKWVATEHTQALRVLQERLEGPRLYRRALKAETK